MLNKIVLVGALLLAVTAQAARVTGFSPSSLGKFNDFVKVPRTDSPTSNSVDEAINSGGRLITRHLEYLASAGYKSVLSVSEFSTNDTTFNGVSGDFPSSDYEMKLLNSFGLEARTVSASMTERSAKQISQLMDTLPKPLYVHCHVSFFSPPFAPFYCD